MKEIIAYKTIEKNTIDTLDRTMNNLIKKGWQPFGNVIMNYHYNKFIQVLVKFKP